MFVGIGRANLAFVIDGTNSELIMFIQRYVYNYIRLFQLQGTYVTIMAYGRDQYRIASWVTFISPQEIQVNLAYKNVALSVLLIFCSVLLILVQNTQVLLIKFSKLDSFFCQWYFVSLGS